MKSIFCYIFVICCTANAQDCLLKKTKCLGKVISRHKAKNFEECSEKCSEGPSDGKSCSFWTFEKTKKGSVCYLLNSCEEKASKYATSGPRGCPPYFEVPTIPSPPSYCPTFIYHDDVYYSFYSSGWTPCSGPLGKCVYKHGHSCYCFGEDSQPNPIPCLRSVDFEFSASDDPADTLFNASIGYRNSNPFNDLEDGRNEIISVQLFPAVDRIRVVCGGIKVQYGNGGEVTHGDTSQTVPLNPVVNITLNLNTRITGASGRFGAFLDQVVLDTTFADGPPLPYKCGGDFGQVVFPPPNPPAGLNCFLYSFAGSTNGDNNYLEKLTLIYICQN